MKNIFSNDYLRLFIRRESLVVLGHRFVNLWILAVMLSLTFLAISFSNASLSFLRQKMDDPFTNWVNLPVESDNDLFRLQQYFGDTASVLNQQYHIEHFSVDYSYHYIFFGKTPDKLPYLGCLFFQSFIDNPLLDAILSPSNIVNDCAVSLDQLNDELIGVIITKEQMESMGYNDSTAYPTYINFHQASEGAEQYGVQLYDGYAMVPIPILAVVRSLPMNMDIVAPLYFFQQQQSVNRPFNLNNPLYASSLIYSVEDAEVAEKIYDFLYDIVDDDIDVSVDGVYMPYNLSFRNSSFVSVEGAYEDLSWEVINDLDQQVREEFEDELFTRVYEYDFSLITPSSGSFVSVQFSSEGLRTIRSFSEFLNKEFHIDIEMSQIQSKENFSAVSVTATILTWTIIFFALVSVLLFIVNLLRNYFQRVKRNMGTFKAFGMSNRELIRIYILILLVIVSGAILFALVSVFILQLLLNVCHLTYEGGNSYLLLGNINTLLAVLVILGSSVLTVYLVMKNQLSATPGDLIYDR